MRSDYLLSKHAASPKIMYDMYCWLSVCLFKYWESHIRQINIYTMSLWKSWGHTLSVGGNSIFHLRLRESKNSASENVQISARLGLQKSYSVIMKAICKHIENVQCKCSTCVTQIKADLWRRERGGCWVLPFINIHYLTVPADGNLVS